MTEPQAKRDADKISNDRLRHDLRNHITPIKEFTALLLEGVAGKLSKQQREYLEYLKDSVEKMSRIVDRL